MLSAPSMDRYARAALVRECEDVARTSSGRNARLNRAAFSLGGLVGGGYLLRADVEGALFEAAFACGYVAKDGPRQARDTIRSGIERGLLEPRDPPAREGREIQPDPRELARQAQERERQRRAREAEILRRQLLALSVWEAANDPRGTPVAPYLNGRALDLSEDLAGPVMRWHPSGPWKGGTAPMMVALMRNVLTGEPQAIQRTVLTADGHKVDRWMLGPAAGAAIMLDPTEDVGTGLVIGEGAESCMSARQFGLRPCWAVGSAGAIAAFPVLPGIEALTLLGENDASGTNQRACEQAAERWYAAGRQIDIITPRIGKDLNDTLKAGAAAWA